jgi:YD repeat-containing protein
MIKAFQLTLPGSRPRLDGAEVAVPARFYQRTVVGGQVSGLWIGGQRVYDVTIYDAADRPVGTIGPDSPQTSASYDALQRVLVCEAMQAGPEPVAVQLH